MRATDAARPLSPAFRRAVASACVLAAVGAARAEPLTAEQLYERVSPSVWQVRVLLDGNKVALGSAVVIAPTTLATNCHVVEGARAMRVFHHGTVHEARLQARDPTRDLCLLHVAQLAAPVVQIAGLDTLRIGARLYAIGNPQGMELTLSDGLLSGIRRDTAGQVGELQISVPITHGSSGGGLFDVQGRLVGITTSGRRDAQFINFALPAVWVLDVAARAGRALPPVARAPEPQPSPESSKPPADPAATPQTPEAAQPALPVLATAAPAGLAIGSEFEYLLRDGLTGATRRVTYRVDRVGEGRVVFNQGGRIEDARGHVLEMSAPIAGEADIAMPPGGWVPPDTPVGSEWRTEHLGWGPGAPRLDLRARIVGEEVVRVAGRDLRTLRVDYTGYVDRAITLPANASGTWRGVAWYSPELGRVVRFKAASRGGSMSSSFVIDEQLELVGLR